MQVGDLVVYKPTIFNDHPRRTQLVMKVYEHNMSLWIRLHGLNHAHEASLFEVVSEAANESR